MFFKPGGVLSIYMTIFIQFYWSSALCLRPFEYQTTMESQQICMSQLHCWYLFLSRGVHTLTMHLLVAYIGTAIRRYYLYPEHMSLMLLTVMELWCSLNVIVCGIVPQFSPEIPVNILEPLIPRGRKHLLRLRQIEQYLAKRHREVAGHFLRCQILSPLSFSKLAGLYRAHGGKP